MVHAKQSAENDLLGDLSAFLTNVLDSTRKQSVVLQVVSGKACSKLGPIVRTFDGASRLAANLYNAAQQDCRALGFAQKYGVFVLDPLLSHEPIARFILPMRPRSS